MKQILVSKKIASDPIKLYKELKSRGVKVSERGQLKFFSIQRDAEDARLCWVSECKEVTSSLKVDTKESKKKQQTLMMQ